MRQGKGFMASVKLGKSAGVDFQKEASDKTSGASFLKI